MNLPVSQANERGLRRDRALFRTFLAGAGAQVATVGGSLISLPFVARTLSPSEFGVFVTITGLIALLGFADLGVGSALTTRIAVAVGEDDDEVLRKLIAAAFVIAGGAACVLAVVGALLIMVSPWARMTWTEGVRASALEACGQAAVAVTVTAMLGSFGSRILYGLQRGSTANLWIVASTIVSALATIVVSLLNGPLFAYVLAGAGVPAMIAVLCTVWVVLGSSAPILRPNWRAVRVNELVALGGASGWFFVIAVSGAAAYQTDVLVVAGVLGAASAGVYSVTVRVFGLVLNSIYPALLQLWPAFGEALARGDTAWVRSRLRSSTLLAGGAGILAGIVLSLGGKAVVSAWLTPEFAAPTSLFVAVGLWTSYTLLVTPYFFLLNAAGEARLHATLTVVVALVNVPVSIVLAGALGLAGPVIASLGVHACFAGVPAALRCRTILRSADLDHEAV